MTDLDYIKKFSKINIKNACIKTGVNRSNVLNGTASKKSINKVREELEKQVAKIYLEENISRKIKDLKGDYNE